MIDALSAITEASENDDIWDSWEKYQDAVWDFKWADESLFDEFLKSVNEHIGIERLHIVDLCADADEFGKVMEELYEDGMNVTVVDDYADSEPYSAVTGYLKDNAYEYMVETK